LVLHDKKSLFKSVKKLNPLVTVPVLETEHGPICESFAILRWAGRQNEALYPSEKRTEIDDWLDTIQNEICSRLDLVLFPAYGCTDKRFKIDKDDLEDNIKKLRKVAKHFHRSLRKKRFLVGDSLTLADLALTVYIDKFFRFLVKRRKQNDYDHLLDYLVANLNETEVFKPFLRPFVQSKEKFPVFKFDLKAEEKKKQEEKKRK
jgi:glutathione S-transferase